MVKIPTFEYVALKKYTVQFSLHKSCHRRKAKSPPPRAIPASPRVLISKWFHLHDEMLNGMVSFLQNKRALIFSIVILVVCVVIFVLHLHYKNINTSISARFLVDCRIS